jgi:hypothetical protein
MIGRDLGVGANKSEFQFGMRIADLRAAASALQNSLTTATTTTFYSSFILGTTTTTTAASVFATWNSRFFGIGPRAGIAGGIPLAGPWSFDYGGGIAGLIGDRKFNVAASNGFAANFNGSAFVFNADALGALSYMYSPHFKVSSGIRGDYYNAALTTYNVNTGRLQNISRIYWGPFVRLTGSF